MLDVATNLSNLFCLTVMWERHISEAYLDPGKTFNMELIKQIANGFKPFLRYLTESSLCEKCPNAELFLFPIFLYSDWIGRFANLRIQSEYEKKRSRNNFVFGHFSRSVWIRLCIYWKVNVLSYSETGKNCASIFNGIATSKYNTLSDDYIKI